MTTLKNELVGTWQLLSYIEVPIKGADSKFPMGQSPKGLLMYGADGFMSVQISNADRNSYVSQDRYLANADEIQEQVKGFIAFAGSYKIDNTNAIVQYSITTSSFPNWEGQFQERKIDFEGDILYLKSVEPILSDGIMVNSYMTWQRIEKAEFVSRREKFIEITASKMVNP
ncbi:hypothetical protein CHU00_01535 [Sphingobacterium cellulitidis]|uniref:lipocalin-like domain-containing protein n=1 Tax=Sphingobacterium cellulitidis TaxID=1768011 RepID=UPI000B93DC1E|nr:lipocalin-like domain-containing protein [Sphingobacterium cellulitidis]OYD47579.1 hypothetical protein CHU00_01535 [Sphingobacterium cellulitidis]